MDNKSKPVLLVTASTFPRWEGDSEPRFVFDLSTRLADDFEVLVLAPHYSGAARYEKCGELQVYRYQYAPTKLETLVYNGGITANLRQNKWKWLLLPGFFLSQWWATSRLIKNKSVNVIHAHWLIPQGLIAVLATRWMAKKPALLCTSHGGDLYGLQDKLSKKLKRCVVQHSQAITVVSSPMVEKISELSGGQTPKVSVIPMGTDLENTFVPNPTVKRLPNQLLFVGRLVEKKGVEYLLRALQQVRQTHRNTTLVIAGSGPLQGKLEKLTDELGLNECVSFLGRLEHQDLVHLYQKSTLAVFPFIQAKDGDMEGLGLVMVEAMGCGCPVIASDLPAIRDVISHKENGYLVEPEDTTALAITCQTLLERSPNYAQFAQRKPDAIHKIFNWTAVTQRYQKVLKPLLTSALKEESHVN